MVHFDSGAQVKEHPYEYLANISMLTHWDSGMINTVIDQAGRQFGVW